MYSIMLPTSKSWIALQKNKIDKEDAILREYAHKEKKISIARLKF